MTGVGFEPTHPKILRPKRSALDHSAILPLFIGNFRETTILIRHLLIAIISNRLIFLLRFTKFSKSMTGVGFEPTHPKILRPERSALDHSAILPLLNGVFWDKCSHSTLFICN